MYGAVVWRPPIHDPNYVAPISIPPSQTLSVERLLAAIIDDGIINAQPRTLPLRPSSENVQRSTTLHTLTENTEDLCHICHDGMLSGQSIRTIRHCHHMFHQLCIDTWFSTRPTCPVCRYDIRLNQDA